jgi:hypothetical protein
LRGLQCQFAVVAGPPEKSTSLYHYGYYVDAIRP